MEDPEKRKERLNAMRMEAAQTDVSKSIETSVMPYYLTNPLAETSTKSPIQEESYGTPKFDYYTDPMSAFSGNRRNKGDQQIKQRYTSSPSNHMGSPVPQFPPSLPGGAYQIHDNQGALQAQGHYNSGILHMDPRGIAYSSSLHYRASHGAWNEFRPPAGNFRPWHSPYMTAGPFPAFQESPEPGNRFGGQGNYNSPPNPVYAPQYSNYGQRNDNWVGRTSPGLGRGRGFGRNMSPNFGTNGGKRPAFVPRDHAASPRIAAERFYDKSMAEDPWQYLKPVLWKSCSDASTSSSKDPASWLPKSIMPKKPRISEARNKSTSNQQSLAEYLAASLEEATDDSQPFDHDSRQ